MDRSLPIFLYGLVAACFALILELILFGVLPVEFFGFLNNASPAPLSLSLIIGLFLFALIEEGVRFLFLLRYTKNVASSVQPLPSTRNEILLAGAIFGLGFAGLETLVGALFGHLARLDVFLAGTFFLHVFLSIGMAFLVFRFSPKTFVFGVFFPFAVLLHLLYNLFVLFVS